MRSHWLRIWLLIVALAFLTGTGWGEASSNTVPRGSWIYSELAILAQQGLIDNYSHHWVESGNELSRFEIAYYIKQVILTRLETTGEKNAHKISEKNIQTLQRLIAEFEDELADLGLTITDIYDVSPKLVKLEPEADGYQDLDQVLSEPVIATSNNEPYYYYGQYYWDLKRKSFLFIPFSYVESDYVGLFENSSDEVNIVYQPFFNTKPSYLVIKGNLPAAENNQIPGYYLFPLEEKVTPNIGNIDILIGMDKKVNDQVLILLDEVNQLNQIGKLYKFSGALPLEGYRRMNTDFRTKQALGNLNNGMKIGGLLIYKNSPLTRTDIETNEFGLPFYNPHIVDMDNISRNDLQALQIKINGSLTVSPQTSVYGGLDLLYRDVNLGLDSLLPSDAKASAGFQYQVNDYLSLLAYQSFVNSQPKSGMLSTTSFGVEYNKSMTLWVAYQYLDFEDPTITGAISFRF